MQIGDKILKPIISQAECDNYSAYANWCNENNAHLEDKGEYLEIVEREPYIPSKTEQIGQLKAQLSATDYKCLKYVDGALSEEEYAETKALRANLRQQINALEG